MGFRFYRRVHVLPGLSVNLSRSGPSLSVGVRGAHLTFGRRGMTRTVGIPGTGIYYTSRSGYHTGYHSAGSAARGAPPVEVTQHRIAGWLTIAVVLLVVLLIGIGIGSIHAQ